MLSDDVGRVAAQVAIPVALLVSFALVRRLETPGEGVGRRLRSRLLFGVPWGTVVSVAGVVSVYLFVQRGLWHWANPVTLPFSSWSYLYPTGVLTAPFSHAGPGHLVGNMTSTLVAAPLAEYYFSHYPRERGGSTFDSWRTNPYVRAFVLFPAGVAAVGLLTSVLAWGPIIGFSGVVFAFGGFSLVRYPLGTVVAFSAQGVVSTLYRALRNPEITASASSSFSRPWWAGIAVQGHALGLFLGAVAGVALLYHRRERPNVLRVWTGAVLLASSLSLWALWWYRGNDSFVLYRGWGVVFVLAVAALVTVAVRATDFPLTKFAVAATLLALPLAVMAGVAIPVNLTTLDDPAVGDANAAGNATVEVNGYYVTYAENVPNEKVSVVDVSVGDETTNVTTSGVIVSNPDREIWTQEVSTGRLAYSGRAAVRVGGVGWSETVGVQRRGWSVTGGGTAYQVWLRPPDGEWRFAFASDPATADPVLAGKNVSVAPTNRTFSLRVSRNNTTLASAPVPTNGTAVELAGIRFENDRGKLAAAVNGTRVRVAAAENRD